ncbi:MAG: endonuclease/exonuclease/phosphatase family protein [Bacteroidota bacterium]
MHYVLKNALRMVSAVVVLLTLLSYLCPLVSPASFRWLAFFGTAFPWLLLANVVLTVLWAWRLNRFALYHLGVIIFGWQFVSGFVGFDFGKDIVPETSVCIATHNLGGMFRGKAYTEQSREKTAAAYANFLQQNGSPDVLCTQETTGKFYHVLAQKMGYDHTFNLKKGTVIMSRFPMEAGGDIPFGKTGNSSIWVDIRMGERLVRVYNLHLQSNSVTESAEKVMEEKGFDEEETWNTIGWMLGKVSRATSIRAEQADMLRDHIAQCNHAVIVCGDFNDTPNSYVYATLSNGFKDTFREKALGFGTTFGGALPLLRIDYILTEPKMNTYACHTIHDANFSDHYPVVVEVGF